jgi:TRAP-type mannitol/chloroaromatic compound transport system permease large subunit
VAPPQITLGTVYRAAMPFLLLELLVLAILVLVPEIGTWLPNRVVR